MTNSFYRVIGRGFASLSSTKPPVIPHLHYPTTTTNSAAAAATTAPATCALFRLQSGQEFTGVSFGANPPSSSSSPAVAVAATGGEVVFTTSLVGYVESMTDPSYKGQILVFTQPLVGNYGVPAPALDKWGLLKDFESKKIQVKGIIVNDYATRYSHWNAVESLGEWCRR